MTKPETQHVRPRLPQACPDEELVSRVLGGETALFELLMRRYNQRLYRVARSIVKADHEAEDVMQEAYVRAYAKLHQFNGQAKFSTWLTKIAVHEALGRLRRNRRLTDLDVVAPSEDPMSPPDQSPEQRVASLELRALLEASIESLPAALRAAYVLRDVEGLSTAEAAACLAVSEDVVRTRLSRARSLLRQELSARANAAAGELFTFLGHRCDRMVAGVIERLFPEG